MAALRLTQSVQNNPNTLAIAVDEIRNSIFDHLAPADAMSLTAALGLVQNNGAGAPIPFSAYTRLNPKTCESSCTPFFVRNTPWIPNPPPYEPPGHINAPCTRTATLNNFHRPLPGGGGSSLEISMCQLPRNEPVPNTHPRPSPANPIVCTPCKWLRRWNYNQRVKSLWFGACSSCDRWIRANRARTAETMRCQCPPVGTHTGDINANRALHKHMCRDHDQAYWTGIAARAQGEIDRRRRVVKRKYNMRKKYPFAKKKTRTPEERAKWVEVDLAAAPGIPACYCGNPLTAAEHARTPVGNWQVRNCVGCREFVYA